MYKRIDRGYAQGKSVTNPVEVSSRIIPAQCLSDHNPVLIKCEDSQERFFPSRYRRNCSLFKEEGTKEKMEELLEKEMDFLNHKGLGLEALLASCLEQATNQTRCWGKQ